MNVLENEKNYRLGGRYTVQKDGIYLAYSASYMEFSFVGKKATASLISDEIWDDPTLLAWVAVFENGGEEPVKRFSLKKGCHEYVLFESDTEKEVTLRLMKYSEAAFSTVGIAGIEVDGSVKEWDNTRNAKKLIRFIGDSITCGYGIEGVLDVDTFTTTQENPWEAYACKAARKTGADMEMVCWSGNGIISHYVDENVNTQRHDKPYIWEFLPYADRELDERLGNTELTLWKPERKPDAIVMNIGTNDASFCREIPERNALFEKELKRVLKELRADNAGVPIVYVYGIMDARLNESIHKVLEELQAEGDKAIYDLGLPLQADEDGKGADYHPSKITHEKASVKLAECLKAVWG